MVLQITANTFTLGHYSTKAYNFHAQTNTIFKHFFLKVKNFFNHKDIICSVI